MTFGSVGGKGAHTHTAQRTWHGTRHTHTAQRTQHTHTAHPHGTIRYSANVSSSHPLQPPYTLPHPGPASPLQPPYTLP